MKYLPRVYTADQGIVFRVLSLNHGIQFHFSVLNRVSFWTRSLVKKSVKFGNERSVYVVPTMCFQKMYVRNESRT